jgi:hypothetical protein
MIAHIGLAATIMAGHFRSRRMPIDLHARCSTRTE